MEICQSSLQKAAQSLNNSLGFSKPCLLRLRLEYTTRLQTNIPHATAYNSRAVLPSSSPTHGHNSSPNETFYMRYSGEHIPAFLTSAPMGWDGRAPTNDFLCASARPDGLPGNASALATTMAPESKAVAETERRVKGRRSRSVGTSDWPVGR
jgi:hypothetical protein